MVHWKQRARCGSVKRYAVTNQLPSQRRRGVKVEESTAILLNHVNELVI
jgi:hypothetical protein